MWLFLILNSKGSKSECLIWSFSQWFPSAGLPHVFTQYLLCSNLEEAIFVKYWPMVISPRDDVWRCRGSLGMRYNLEPGIWSIKLGCVKFTDGELLTYGNKFHMETTFHGHAKVQDSANHLAHHSGRLNKRQQHSNALYFGSLLIKHIESVIA